MTGNARHVPLLPLAWDAGEAANAIEDIVSDALSHFDAERFWGPAHPQDDYARDGQTSIYFGAAGVIWALEYLARIRAVAGPHRFPADPAAFAGGEQERVRADHSRLCASWLASCLAI